MTLTTRLSLFFLATLACVLIGFSSALYVLARGYLHTQSDERLDAALNTLVAAAEVTPEGVEWEPTERNVILGPAASANQVAWLVRDDQGRAIDRSRQPGTDDFLAEAAQTLHSSQKDTKRLDWRGERWQCTQRHIQPDFAPERSGRSPSAQKDDGRKYPALSIIVGVSLEPVRATLHRLAGALIALSLGIWLLALFVGRLVCRRALVPVTRMATAAREMRVDDLGGRLPAVNANDELGDLSGAFNNLLDRLQESFERQRRFTGDASHQLRTPLTAILGQVEVALRRERPVAEYQRVLATVHQKAEHLKQIVESLLFLARSDADARRPGLTRLNLKDWLAEVVHACSERERAADVRLECAGVDAVWVEAQPPLLEELVNLLIDNACKFSRPGTPIRVRLEREHRVACILVQDQGCGVGEAELPQLFTPFFRSAETRNRGIEGVGLGLSIAKRLAEAFGGTLSVASQVGQGSCFTLRLPMAELSLPVVETSNQG